MAQMLWVLPSHISGLQSMVDNVSPCVRGHSLWYRQLFRF